MSNTDYAMEPDTQSVTQSQSVTHSVTTSGRARARTREDGITEIHHDHNETLRAVQLHDLAEYYQSSFGNYCPQCARRDMAAALDQGISYEVILICIDEAAIAPRPSWAYARAILRRCLTQELHTEEEYNRQQGVWALHGGKRAHELPY